MEHLLQSADGWAISQTRKIAESGLMQVGTHTRQKTPRRHRADSTDRRGSSHPAESVGSRRFREEGPGGWTERVVGEFNATEWHGPVEVESSLPITDVTSNRDNIKVRGPSVIQSISMGPFASFRFRVPGQPPSWNHSYKIIRRKGGSMGMAKVTGIEPYQLLATVMARRAKPDSWTPGRLVIVRYWFHVNRDVDCTNAIKILEDAIAIGIGVNDRLFLPQAMDKTTGNNEPYVLVEVE